MSWFCFARKSKKKTFSQWINDDWWNEIININNDHQNWQVLTVDKRGLNKFVFSSFFFPLTICTIHIHQLMAPVAFYMSSNKTYFRFLFLLSNVIFWRFLLLLLFWNWKMKFDFTIVECTIFDLWHLTIQLNKFYLIYSFWAFGCECVFGYFTENCVWNWVERASSFTGKVKWIARVSVTNLKNKTFYSIISYNTP